MTPVAAEVGPRSATAGAPRAGPPFPSPRCRPASRAWTNAGAERRPQRTRARRTTRRALARPAEAQEALWLHHPAHVGHAAAHGAGALLVLDLGDDRLGREDVLRD